MNQSITTLLFALLRSAIGEKNLTEDEKSLYSRDILQELMLICQKHDITSLLATGLEKNALIFKDDKGIIAEIVKSIYRYQQISYDFEKACNDLISAKIAFVPLKGSVLRSYYPEPWMRTSCDIDILVHKEDLDYAISYLTKSGEYTLTGRGAHDVSLVSQGGTNIELHFDLLEEGRANNANSILKQVWSNVRLKENSEYWYEMTDEFFYFYHIAHMAKHFENGGCGIRPFIDVFFLDSIHGADISKRDKILEENNLLTFANHVRNLSGIWFGSLNHNKFSVKIQEFILYGGAYGNTQNRVALQQQKKGGRFGYFASRVVASREKLKGYYPILEKHGWLLPVMQIRRWFMLLRPEVAQMAKSEILLNSSIDKTKTAEMTKFLEKIGL